jgi:hypothetical protein
MKLHFNLGKYVTLEQISNAFFMLNDVQKEMLEELKDSDQTMDEKVYKAIQKNICEVFEKLRTPLLLRMEAIRDAIKSHEKREIILQTLRNKKEGYLFKAEKSIISYQNKLGRKEIKRKKKWVKKSLAKENEQKSQPP